MVTGVERPLTIAVTGAHSTGKSTFLAKLAHELRQHDIEVATAADLGEQAQQIGLPILHSHTYASTLWIMTRGISNEIATWPHADVLLIDRPVPDALGYYLAALDYRAEPPDPALLGHLRTLALHYLSHTAETGVDPDRAFIILFIKSTASLAGQNDDSVRPAHVRLLKPSIGDRLLPPAGMRSGAPSAGSSWAVSAG